LLDFEKLMFGTQGPKTASRQQFDRSIDQIRRDIYDSHRHRAYSLAYYMTGDEVSAEDLLVRCFTRAFASRPEPDGGDVDRSLLAELRADGLLGEMELRGMPEVKAGSVGGGNLLRTDLEEALQELPASERLIFLLSDVEGYGAAKIAELTGHAEQDLRRAVMGVRLRLREAVAVLREKRERAG
jgi:RNA polymerase sigma-70 factor (ECF subfamily)